MFRVFFFFQKDKGSFICTSILQHLTINLLHLQILMFFWPVRSTTARSCFASGQTRSKPDRSAFYCACNISNTYQQHGGWLPHVRKHSRKAFSLLPKTQRRCMMSSSADHRKQIFLQEKTAIHFFTTFSQIFHKFSVRLHCCSCSVWFS